MREKPVREVAPEHGVGDEEEGEDRERHADGPPRGLEHENDPDGAGDDIGRRIDSRALAQSLALNDQIGAASDGPGAEKEIEDAKRGVVLQPWGYGKVKEAEHHAEHGEDGELRQRRELSVIDLEDYKKREHRPQSGDEKSA